MILPRSHAPAWECIPWRSRAIKPNRTQHDKPETKGNQELLSPAKVAHCEASLRGKGQSCILVISTVMAAD